MLLSLAACGADTMIGSVLSVSLEGNGKTSLKVTVVDKLEQEYTLEYILAEGEAPVYQAALTDEAEHSHTYQISPTAVGTSSFGVKYMDGESQLAIIIMDITVLETGKIYYSELSMTAPQDFYETVAENVEVSVSEGPTKTLQLSNEQGDWTLGEFDSTILTVNGPLTSIENKTDSFVITGIADGSSDLYLICEDALVQLKLNFKSTMTGTAEDGTQEFELTLESSETQEYKPTTSSEYKQALDNLEKEIAEVISETSTDGTEYQSIFPVDEDGKLDDDFVIEDADFFKNSPDYQETESAEDDDRGILADMTFSYDGITMDYQVSNKMTKSEYDKAVQEEEKADVQKTITGGAITASYFFMPSGYAVATWEQSGIAHRLTFISGGSGTVSFESMLKELLENGAL